MGYIILIRTPIISFTIIVRHYIARRVVVAPIKELPPVCTEQLVRDDIEVQIRFLVEGLAEFFWADRLSMATTARQAYLFGVYPQFASKPYSNRFVDGGTLLKSC